MAAGPPRVVLVGTPIGNLGDLAPRAVEALASADVVACEDTRRTGRLLAHAGVRAPRLVRFDDHTENQVAPTLVDMVREGGVVAVVSDAGMPGLSDPGARLVALAAARGVTVEVVPGPFAGAVALVGSGLLDPSGRFCFEGFLPRKGAARSARLRELVGERRTIVLYEAPHRLVRTLEDLAEVLGGDRRVAVARELTKRYEEVWRGTIAEAVTHSGVSEPRGEHVVVIEGDEPPAEVGDDTLRADLEAELRSGSTRRDAAAAVALRHGVAPNRVKRLVTSTD
jgi:16S rRNA (cytidine1402-2'-O)-methyltransferase